MKDKDEVTALLGAGVFALVMLWLTVLLLGLSGIGSWALGTSLGFGIIALMKWRGTL